jgi:hypothetical protein
VSREAEKSASLPRSSPAANTGLCFLPGLFARDQSTGASSIAQFAMGGNETVPVPRPRLALAVVQRKNLKELNTKRWILHPNGYEVQLN